MRRIGLVVFIVGFTVLLSACGGGGGSGSTTDNILEYTGQLTPANIDATNAQDLAIGAYFGQQSGTFVNASVTAKAISEESTPTLPRISQALRRAIQLDWAISHPLLPETKDAIRTRPITTPGTCGGQAVSQQTIDPDAGTFTVSMQFDSYCDNGTVLDGKTTASGTYDSFSSSVLTYTYVFRPLNIVQEGLPYTMEGKLSVNLTGPEYAVAQTLNLLFRDDTSGLVYKIENYFSGINLGSSYIEETLTGRYYHPFYGYVDISTDQPLRIYNHLIWPSSGTLRCNSESGSSLKLVFTTFDDALIEADIDGDGSYEWSQIIETPLPPDQTPVNHQPVSDAGQDQVVYQGVKVSLDGRGSNDPEGDTLTYQWSFINCPGTCPSLTGPTTATPSFNPADSGTYTLSLVVHDGLLSSSGDLVSIKANPLVPSQTGLLEQEWMFGTYGESIGQGGLSAFDLDGNGTLEIIATAKGPGNFWYVLRNDAPLGYRKTFHSSYSSETINRLLVTDLDNNGVGDILIGYQNGKIDIIDGFNFEVTQSIQTPGAVKSLAVADLTGGDSKEIVTTDGQRLFTYEPNGTLLWETTAYGGDDLAIGNVDNDPALEVVIAASGHGYVLDTLSQTLEWDYINGFGRHVDTGDIDGDGREEIVAAGAWNKIALIDAEIQTVKKDILSSHDIGTLLVRDLDDDGISEILYGDGQWGEIHCYEGDGTTERWAIDNPDHGTTRIAVGDVDNDGSSEILWGAGATSTGADHLFIADTVTGIKWQSDHLDGPLTAVAVGDVDDDGSDEIVMVSYMSNSGYDDGVVHIFDASTHTLEGKITDLPNIDTWVGVSSIRIADVDNDGQTEFVIATSNLYNGLVQVYNGSSLELEQQSDGTNFSGEIFTALEVADVDGDGATEIVVGTLREHTGAYGAHVAVFNGATLALEWLSPTLVAGWHQVADIHISDADGDGRQEILAAVEGQRIYAIDGVTHQYDWMEALPATSIATQDLDKDGHFEILVGQNDGLVGIYDGPSFTMETFVSSLSTSPVTAINLVDIDNDGEVEWLIASGGFLRTLENGTGDLLWQSSNLGGNLGRFNHLPVKDIDDDGKKEILVGSNFALYQFD